jgi:hypothetical protein
MPREVRALPAFEEEVCVGIVDFHEDLRTAIIAAALSAEGPPNPPYGLQS